MSGLLCSVAETGVSGFPEENPGRQAGGRASIFVSDIEKREIKERERQSVWNRAFNFPAGPYRLETKDKEIPAGLTKKEDTKKLASEVS